MNKRQVNPYEWIKVTNKQTNETYKGQFVSCGLDGITIVMENGKEKLFEHIQYMMLIFYIEIGRKLIVKVCVLYVEWSQKMNLLLLK